MKEKNLTFYSNGYRLASILYLPEDYKEGEKYPCVVVNSGYMGLNSIYPALYARALTKKGYAVFGFDYRGFLENEGPSGVCKLEEQVEDIRNAVVFASLQKEVNSEEILLVGWGMAAALVMKAAALEPMVKAVAGLNGFYNGERWLASVNTYADFVKLKEEVKQERIRFIQSGERKFDNPFHFYPLDPETKDVVVENLYVVKGYGQEISLEIGQSILEFNAEDYSDALNIPVFVGYGKDNLLHPAQESVAFFSTLHGDHNQLYKIDGKHNDFMFDDHPIFLQLVASLDTFFKHAL
ncbi:alpha/beta hydrolase [Oscillospiraceae bacterium LTW-04]|nr:alpha/beta hydrolase [Oscillospiraceae bacterium MB24-C1]